MPRTSVLLSAVSTVVALSAASCATRASAETAEAGAAADADGDEGPGEPFELTPKPQKSGFVEVGVHGEFPLGADTFHARAGFQTFGPGEIPDRLRSTRSRATACRRLVSGACELVTCLRESATEDGLATPALVDAGTITITRANGERLSLTGSAENVYQGRAEDPAPASEGESVTITIDGGDVPPVDETIELVGALSLTTSETIEVATGADAEIAWSGRKTGTVVLYARFGDETTTRIGDVTCRFDAAAGKGSIPRDLLAAAPKSLSFGLQRDVVTKNIGGYELSFAGSRGPFGAGNGTRVAVSRKD